MMTPADRGPLQADEADALEAAVTRNVRRLPPPRAPHTLLPRVMTAVQQWAQRPWYTREWFTWPLGWQIASAAALVTLLVGIASARGVVMGIFAGAAPLPGVMAAASGLTQGAALVIQTAGALARALGESIGPYIAAVVLLMCLACAAFGLALTYVVNITGLGPQAERSA